MAKRLCSSCTVDQRLYVSHASGALSFSLCFYLSLSWVTITVMQSTTEPTATTMEATAVIPLSRLRRCSTRLQHFSQIFVYKFHVYIMYV